MQDYKLESVDNTDNFGSCADIVFDAAGKIVCVEYIDLLAQQCKKLLETVGPGTINTEYGTPFRTFMGRKFMNRGPLIMMYLFQAVSFLKNLQVKVTDKPDSEILASITDIKKLSATPKQMEIFFTAVSRGGDVVNISI